MLKLTSLPRKSPLARFQGDSGAAMLSVGTVQVVELPFQGVLRVQCRDANPAFQAVARDVLGVKLPLSANTRRRGAVDCLWIGPNDWLLVTRPVEDNRLLQQLQTRLAKLQELTTAVTLLTDARTVLQVSGAAARDLLNKGCALDLHPDAFAPGQCAMTLLEQVPVALYPGDEHECYYLLVDRSYAAFVWRWLQCAIKEFGEAA